RERAPPAHLKRGRVHTGGVFPQQAKVGCRQRERVPPVGCDLVAPVLTRSGLKEAVDYQVLALVVGQRPPVKQAAGDPPLLARELRGRPQVARDLRFHQYGTVAVAEYLMADISAPRPE